MNAMHSDLRDRSVDRVVEALEQEGDDVFAHLRPRTRRNLVKQAIANAQDLGFKTDHAFAWFADVMLRVGPRFHLQQNIRAALTRGAGGETVKIRHAVAVTSDSDWKEAAKL